MNSPRENKENVEAVKDFLFEEWAKERIPAGVFSSNSFELIHHDSDGVIFYNSSANELGYFTMFYDYDETHSDFHEIPLKRVVTPIDELTFRVRPGSENFYDPVLTFFTKRLAKFGISFKHAPSNRSEYGTFRMYFDKPEDAAAFRLYFHNMIK